ncbi:MAG: hypothetical protein ACPGO5_01645 [Patescibacteria group bacterium]
MTLSKKSKRFIYDISTLILKWSLVYLLVLFFLEDTRPYMISTVFSPHWMLLVLVLGLTGVLWTAPYGHMKSSEGIITTAVKNYDVWIARVVVVLLYIYLIMQFSPSFMGYVLFAGVMYVSYRILLILMEEDN